jgi:hypothetical protein
MDFALENDLISLSFFNCKVVFYGKCFNSHPITARTKNLGIVLN